MSMLASSFADRCFSLGLLGKLCLDQFVGGGGEQPCCGVSTLTLRLHMAGRRYSGVWYGGWTGHGCPGRLYVVFLMLAVVGAGAVIISPSQSGADTSVS